MGFKLKLIVLCLFFFGNFFSKTNELKEFAIILKITKTDTVLIYQNALENIDVHRPNPILQLFKSKQKKNKKLIAAALAFPFPFGMVGLHRIYLGTAPYVPVVYIGTIGGGFGILPFIDFCILLLDKDIDRFINNTNVFMWANNNEHKKTTK